MPLKKPILRGFACPEGFKVGWVVSEVRAAFVTTANLVSDRPPHISQGVVRGESGDS
jgi:hypothetical protein